MKKILQRDFITTCWSGGETSQIYIDPPHASVAKKNFNYRISTATCEKQESVYTPYPGFWRYLTPLNREMTINEEGNESSLKPFEVYSFSGDHQVFSTGDVRDFNLIFRKGLEAKMYSVCDRELSYCAPCKAIIFKFDGDSTLNGEMFESFCAVELERGEEICLEGKGRHIFCEIGNVK